MVKTFYVNFYCKSAEVLKADSVYKQYKDHHPQVYAVDSKYADAKASNATCYGIHITIDILRYKGGMNRCSKDKFRTKLRVTRRTY